MPRIARVYADNCALIDKVTGLRDILEKGNRCLVKLGCGHYSITDKVIEQEVPEWRGNLYEMKQRLREYLAYRDRHNYEKTIYGIKKEIEELENLKFKKKTSIDFGSEYVECHRCRGKKDPLEKLYGGDVEIMY